MTPAAVAFRAARETLGLSQAEFALALGYQNHDRQGLRQQVNDMEAGRKSITPQTGRLAEMFRRFGVPPEFLTAGDEPCRPAPSSI
jgi:transcriptional regulator with XRE-family HTH domain